MRKEKERGRGLIVAPFLSPSFPFLPILSFKNVYIRTQSKKKLHSEQTYRINLYASKGNTVNQQFQLHCAPDQVHDNTKSPKYIHTLISQRASTRSSDEKRRSVLKIPPNFYFSVTIYWVRLTSYTNLSQCLSSVKNCLEALAPHLPIFPSLYSKV